jgi:hypothetical protein
VPGQILFDGHRQPSFQGAIQPITPLSVVGVAVVGVKQYAVAWKKSFAR